MPEEGKNMKNNKDQRKANTAGVTKAKGGK